MLNKAIKVVKDILKKSDKPTEEESQIWRYWNNCIKRSEKSQPTTEWTAAVNRLKCKRADDKQIEEKPYVNGFRQHYESLKSFLDQTIAEFNVSPTISFLTDPVTIKEAECDLAYLSYVWGEQKCQTVSSQKLDSCIIRNIGVTLPGFDKKKWMPNLKYIPAKNFLFDPDCDGIRANAGWEGYKEPIAIEQLKAIAPDLSDPEIKKIKSQAGSLLSDEEKGSLDADEPENKMFTTIWLYHIFARNETAIRKFTDGEEEIPDKKVISELNFAVPKRYLQIVKGLERPLKDEDGWPYELDDNEFPTTVLKFNALSEDTYGFTDHEQMSRLDTAFDNVMHDLEESAYWEGNKKFVGGPEAADLTAATIEKYLKDPKKYYFADMKGSDGKPKIEMVDTGKFSKELVLALDVLDKQRDKASAIGELLAETAAQYKDVAATSALIHDANVHQKVNRRLGGPEGYETSIAEDAVKMLEIAHQFVPQYSLLEIPVPKVAMNEGEIVETGETFMDLRPYPWEQAKLMLKELDVTLVMLGIDAVVGPELAQYWRTAEDYSPQLFKLSTRIRVLPGSTRTITKERRAAILKEYYNELYLPLYQVMGRWDLARNFLAHISSLIGLGEGQDFVPDRDSMMKFNEEWKRIQQRAQMEGGKGAVA